MLRRRGWTPDTWGVRVGHARVLVEDADAAERAASENVLRQAGYDVAGCGGPEAMGRRTCPLVHTGECGLVAGADVVYNHLALSNQDNRLVVRALRAHASRTPVVMEVPATEVLRFHPLLVDKLVVRAPALSANITRAVGEALVSRRA
jgi:hypothetical protein